MAFSSIIRTIASSPLLEELTEKLAKNSSLHLSGLPRLPKGLVGSAIAQAQDRSMCVITATLEEAGRWAVQLEAMGWQTVHFYPTADTLPYDPVSPEAEMVWAQMQVLADLSADLSADLNADSPIKPKAIVATVKALQIHLPSPHQFQDACWQLSVGKEINLEEFALKLTQLGYERTSLVETEGTWSRRGDIFDIFPVASELPLRLDCFGDVIEKIREFDPATQRAIDSLPSLNLTPISYDRLLGEDSDRGKYSVHPQASASLLDYLADDYLIVIDEPDQCRIYSDRNYEAAERMWQSLADRSTWQIPLHQKFSCCLERIEEKGDRLFLAELGEEKDSIINLNCRSVPAISHQFGNLAKTIREYRGNHYRITVVSAQPTRAVSLLQEHDCAAQFVPNVHDFPAIEKLHNGRTPVALKYSGLAEIQGFVLPLFRILLVSDREFFGQHALGTPSYIRKRRRGNAKTIDANKLSPGDYVVHKQQGIGQFLKLETLTVSNETREYLVIKYEDGLLRVAADQVSCLSRYRGQAEGKPQLHRMTSKAWTNTVGKARKAIKKVAFDLLELYAKRSQQVGFAFPMDAPWQQEMEDSFPYQPTPDQLKATQDVKQDMESDRPMDRLVCGDVGFGKTEVAVRALFKAMVSGKQAAMLAPTTILAQQHYHTLQERFAPYPIQIALLNRFKSASEKKEIVQKLATGELDLVVGTHQLLGKEVKFKDLGLLVIDEEQRFGVAQKEKIKSYKTEVDILTLTATPIPRTLYMSLSGVREMSLITTPPPSRRSIKTHLSRYEPEKVRAAIRQELDRGGQVFYVVSRIDGIEETSTQIREMLPDVRMAIAHGQMPESELETTMLTFNSGEADVLVCTTIIESGLDIPRVNTIIIEDSHRLGLGQLYQLRGRVGRSGIQAHAWLFYPETGELSEPARKRLQAIQEFAHLGSGYQLAMRDMEIRGAGNLLGAEQSGQMDSIGFDLYMEMLQECISEIRGSEIPAVDDTQVDLPITAFIPSSYIADPDQKMSAYRNVAAANSRRELNQILEEWSDRYGKPPVAAQRLIQVMELKQNAKRLGFSRIKGENKIHAILETKMEEPAWKRLHQALPSHIQSRFVYQPGKVTVRGLLSLTTDKQLENLIYWFEMMQVVLNDKVLG
jgi:transcription-repair coupling factor (superfamily II helicase)